MGGYRRGVNARHSATRATGSLSAFGSCCCLVVECCLSLGGSCYTYHGRLCRCGEGVFVLSVQETREKTAEFSKHPPNQALPRSISPPPRLCLSLNNLGMLAQSSPLGAVKQSGGGAARQSGLVWRVDPTEGAPRSLRVLPTPHHAARLVVHVRDLLQLEAQRLLRQGEAAPVSLELERQRTHLGLCASVFFLTRQNQEVVQRRGGGCPVHELAS